MTLPLLHKPIPFGDESPGSLLIRISENNGWQSPSSLLVAQNYQYSKNSTVNIESIMCNKKKWDNVLDSFSITNHSTHAACYNRLGLSHRDDVNFLGIPIPWSKLRIRKPSICPKCIKENQYHKNIWDLKLINSCSKHGVRLIESCSTCGEKINWNRKYLSKCKCGEKLEKFPVRTCNVEITLFLEKLVKSKNTKTLNLLFKFHSVYEEFYKFVDISMDQHALAQLCFQSLKTPKKVTKLITKILTKLTETRGIHPRLALHPFLTSDTPEIKKIVQDCLYLVSYKKPKKVFIEGSIHFTATSRILGISQHRTKTLVYFGILEKFVGLNATAESPLLVTLESINNLLVTCSKRMTKKNTSRSFKSIKELTNTFQYCHTFIGLMQEVVSGDREYSGEKVIIDGLKGISIKPSSEEKYTNTNATLTIKEIAKLCDVNYENIRFAIHSGILKRIPSEEIKGKTIYVEKNDASEFNRRYIFSGTLAKQFGLNATNLAEKIFSTGIKAISGPNIDGGLVYLFRRVDVNTLDINKVSEITNFPTKTGRKKETFQSSEDNSISLKEASRLLNVSVQRASQLLRDGFIVEHSCLIRERRCTIESVRRILAIKRDNSLVPTLLAAKSIEENIQQFRMRWLQTGFVDSINTGIDSYISKVDLKRIKDFKRQNIIAREARELTGINESQIRAFKNSNIIKLSKQLGMGRKKVIFYDREEVMCVCHQA